MIFVVFGVSMVTEDEGEKVMAAQRGLIPH